MQALLIIDIQNDYFPGGRAELVNPEAALANAKKLLHYFRGNKLPVIHVQHINTREGASFFLPNTSGANIHEQLKPLENEYLVVKNYPNSFYGTDLCNILNKNITELVVCGMMTHMCIDTTVRAAKDYEIPVTLIYDACATKDLTFNEITVPAEQVQAAFMASLSGMFAQITAADDYIG
ncbi:cysteine hydrolase [Deltaproteobacteria bacterium Smac51]|nr:cysteine hydrolase [Deltaproteobacteria bacterium Smac51]